MGWTIPVSLSDAASSASRPGSNTVRGWNGFGSRLEMGTVDVDSGGVSAGSGTGRSAESPLPSAFLFIGHDFLREIQVRLGASRPYVIEQYWFTETGRLGQPHAARHHAAEQAVLEELPGLLA